MIRARAYTPARFNRYVTAAIKKAVVKCDMPILKKNAKEGITARITTYLQKILAGVSVSSLIRRHSLAGSSKIWLTLLNRHMKIWHFYFR
jgi:hypothetical protein